MSDLDDAIKRLRRLCRGIWRDTEVGGDVEAVLDELERSSYRHRAQQAVKMVQLEDENERLRRWATTGRWE